MGHCKECKYFDIQTKDSMCNENFGYCNCDKFEYIENISKEDYNKYHLIYWDYELYMSAFKVHKDFGCINFERK